MQRATLDQIKERTERIGLPLPELCRRANVDPSTVYRWLQGKGAHLDVFTANVERLEAELQRAEREQLRYLQGLPHLKT